MNENKKKIDLDIENLLNMREEKKTPDVKVWECMSSSISLEIWKHKKTGNIFEIVV